MAEFVWCHSLCCHNVFDGLGKFIGFWWSWNLHFRYLQNIDPETHWGPAGEARTYVGALRGMEKLQAIRRDHVKTYRPQFLIMCGSPANDRMSLVKFATMMKMGHGVNVYGSVLIQDTPNADLMERKNAVRSSDKTCKTSKKPEKICTRFSTKMLAFGGKKPIIEHFAMWSGRKHYMRVSSTCYN